MTALAPSEFRDEGPGFQKPTVRSPMTACEAAKPESALGRAAILLVLSLGTTPIIQEGG